MSRALYELYDSLTMLISPTLEAAFDLVELLSAKRGSRRRQDHQARPGEHATLGSSKTKVDEARMSEVSA